MSHATLPAPGHPALAAGFRVVYHAPICPDCGSSDVITEDVETGDGLTETALICRSCGTAWPLACVTEHWATALPTNSAAARR
jgi:hypothetical protein